MITIAAVLSLVFASVAYSLVHAPRQLHTEDTLAILSIVNCWRHTRDVNPLVWSQDMTKAAANTGQLNYGGAAGMNHHVPPGAAEVIAPGSDTAMGQDLKGCAPFRISFIAWICERPSSRMGVDCSLVDVNNPNAVMPM